MDSHTFEGWMARVNAHLAKKVGMSADDLPDCCYRDWFDSKVSPSEAARMAIAEAKGY